MLRFSTPSRREFITMLGGAATLAGFDVSSALGSSAAQATPVTFGTEEFVRFAVEKGEWEVVIDRLPAGRLGPNGDLGM